MSTPEDRYFKNPFGDYNGEKLLKSKRKLCEKFSENLKTNINQLLERLYEGLCVNDDNDDYSIYTGTTGIALLHFHLYKAIADQNDSKYLLTALDYIKHPLRRLKGHRCTFLCGDAGPLALGAVLYHLLGHRVDSKECINSLERVLDTILHDEDLPSELMYGRAGYLSALLFVRTHLGPEAINPECIRKICESIIESGKAIPAREGLNCPLMYTWHDKKYLGAAHGLAGILVTLMQVDDPDLQAMMAPLIRPTIDYMMTLRFPSGNCPSSIGNQTDRLVHWCHGAPGWIHVFTAAHKVYGSPEYLDAAKSLADVIWNRGILKKGYGLCHGTAGNAYAALIMFQHTQDQMYLYRACKFAEWCFNHGEHGCRTADRPMSLFEGLAGTIYFLADLLDPENAKFPAFVY